MTKRIDTTNSAQQTGFTLIELMITVAIAAILVTIAATSYSSSVQKSRRTDARNAIMDIAAREERFLSVSNSYSSTTTDVGYTGAWPQLVSNGYYNVSVQVPDPAQPTVTNSYIVTATATGPQLNDTACATFTVNQIGQQTALTSGNVLNTNTCWGI